MVEWIKSWAITICAAVIFITAVELIIPSYKYKKYVQFVLGLILISVILNPIIKIINSNKDITSYIDNATKYINNNDFNKDLEKYKQSDKENTIINFKSNMENSCNDILKKQFKGNDFKVTASINYDDNTKALTVSKLEVGIQNYTKIEKVQINSSSKENSNNDLNDALSIQIKNYLNNELKISKENIRVYKLN